MRVTRRKEEREGEREREREREREKEKERSIEGLMGNDHDTQKWCQEVKASEEISFFSSLASDHIDLLVKRKTWFVCITLRGNPTLPSHLQQPHVFCFAFTPSRLSFFLSPNKKKEFSLNIVAENERGVDLSYSVPLLHTTQHRILFEWLTRRCWLR